MPTTTSTFADRAADPTVVSVHEQIMAWCDAEARRLAALRDELARVALVLTAPDRWRSLCWVEDQSGCTALACMLTADGVPL